MTFLELAEIVLKEEKKPLSTKNIIERSKNIEYKKTGKTLFHVKESDGKTPEQTLGRDLREDIRDKGKTSKFVRFRDKKEVTYSLREKYENIINATPDIFINQNGR